MLRIFGRNKLYLKNASVIEAMAGVNSLALDKTGTLTQPQSAQVSFEGAPLSDAEQILVKAVTRQSSHPLSKLIAASIPQPAPAGEQVNHFREYSGKGIEAVVNEVAVKMGAAGFLNQTGNEDLRQMGTHVHLAFGNRLRDDIIFQTGTGKAWIRWQNAQHGLSAAGTFG